MLVNQNCCMGLGDRLPKTKITFQENVSRQPDSLDDDSPTIVCAKACCTAHFVCPTIGVNGMRTKILKDLGHSLTRLLP